MYFILLQHEKLKDCEKVEHFILAFLGEQNRVCIKQRCIIQKNWKGHLCNKVIVVLHDQFIIIIILILHYKKKRWLILISYIILNTFAFFCMYVRQD